MSTEKIAVEVPFTDQYDRGIKKLYRLSPPLTGEDLIGETYSHKYVIASGANAPYSGPETYVFPANEEGEIMGWSELEGSFRGDIDCDRAIENAGYTVLKDEARGAEQ